MDSHAKVSAHCRARKSRWKAFVGCLSLLFWANDVGRLPDINSALNCQVSRTWLPRPYKSCLLLGGMDSLVCYFLLFFCVLANWAGCEGSAVCRAALEKGWEVASIRYAPGSHLSVQYIINMFIT